MPNRRTKLPESFHVVGEHIGIDLPGAGVVFTTRRGGCSTGPYSSLNLGRRSGDDPETVERNRAALERRFEVTLVYGRQVHGSSVRRLTETPAREAEPVEADGQATTLPGVAPMVLTADCLPIALAGDGAVAMVHAGWRGLVAGVIAEGVGAIRELSADGRLTAAIGPGAGGCCYEVGEEVHRAFAAHGPSARRGRNLDLKAIARIELERAGVAEIHDVELCTICSDASLFYSHRREHGITGRQAGFAWLTGPRMADVTPKLRGRACTG
jgi:purine-nucleoside/S-methyl-5'-thioadenosine phosphorylase / adenosine deaminase